VFSLAGKPAQEFEKTHDELELSIIDIHDGEDTSIMNGSSEYNPRENTLLDSTPSKIKYKLKNPSALVFIVTEAVSENRV